MSEKTGKTDGDFRSSMDSDPPQSHIGSRIHERREALGLTLEDIAAELNVNRSTVMRYESGQTRRIPLSTVRRLAAILKTTPEYLLGLDGLRQDTLGLDEDVIVMARVLQSVPQEKRELFNKMLQMIAGPGGSEKGLK